MGTNSANSGVLTSQPTQLKCLLLGSDRQIPHLPIARFCYRASPISDSTKTRTDDKKTQTKITKTLKSDS